MRTLCEMIQRKYTELVSLHGRWRSLSEGGLLGKDRREFLRQGEKAVTDIAECQSAFGALIDAAIKERIETIGRKSGVNYHIIQNLEVYDSVVYFEDTSNIFSFTIEALAALIIDQQTPIKKLSLMNVTLGGIESDRHKLDRLTEALRKPQNKVRRLDLRWCSIGDYGARSIASLLGNPNSQLSHIDLRNNGISVSVEKEVKKAASRAGRKIEIIF